MNLSELLRLKRTIRVIGFDDAPFVRQQVDPVAIAGVVCGGTRFEGMLWGQIQIDGWDATTTLERLLRGSKFLPQLHAVLLDGISMGGFNVIDLPVLSESLDRPCIAVMRRMPNLDAMRFAMSRLPQAEKRWETLLRAGPIHAYPPFYFQVWGEHPDIAAQVLHGLTDRGHVPEALRLAHLISAAVLTGESGRQA